MRRRFLPAVAAWVALLFCCGQSAYGQATGSFLGTVTDQSGSAIVGAVVTVTSQETGVSRRAVTDGTGHYAVNLLPVSIYTVRVESRGFQPVESKNVSLQVNDQRELDFSLRLASVSATVEVVATSLAVNTTNASLGQVINSQQVAQLPLNGRDFVQLAILTPGATQESNPNSFFTSGADSEVAARGSFSLSVGGSRPNSTDWLLDGVDNNELTAGGIAVLSSIDSIREFKVLTYNYSAEYGTRAGPTVLVTSQSGTNRFHGSLFEFLRNTNLDARSFFAASREKFNLNQFGGTVGGPIQKDKTFFFVDGEQKYLRRGITFTGLLPSLAMRAGDFSADPFGNAIALPAPDPGDPANPAKAIVPANAIINPNMVGAAVNPSVFPNVYFQCGANGKPLAPNADGSQPQGTPCYRIPAKLFDPIGQALMGLYPPTNANNAAAGFNFVNSPVRRLDETKFDVRLDHSFSGADSAFARFSYDQAESYVPGGSSGFAEANPFGSNQGIINHARNVAIGETHVFSSRTVNQALFGYNRIFDYITSQGSGTCISQTIGGGIPGANTSCDSNNKCFGFSCGLSSTSVLGGFWALGDRGYSPFQGGTNVFSVSDSLNVIRGHHDLTLGGAIRGNQMNVGTEAFQDGFWIIGNGGNFTGIQSAGITGNAEADLLLGITGLAIHDQTFKGPVTGRRWKIYRPFIQDDWQVSRDLTLNLGLAWDLTTPISEVAGRQADFLPSTGQLLITGQNGVGPGAGIKMNLTAFEPRLGLAWKVFGSDKTALRAGYSIFHDSAWSMGAQGLWQNPPFFAESDAFASQGCAFATSYCAIVLGQTPAGVSLSSGFARITTPPDTSTFTGTFLTEDPKIKLGKVQEFNVTVERQLPGQLMLTVGYAGSRGNHTLMFGNDVNLVNFSGGPDGGPTACGTVSGYSLGCAPGGKPVPVTFPNFPFSTILAINDSGKTQYDSLQVKAETRSARYGLYALIGYTYSRAFDNGLSDGLGSVLSAPYFPLPNWPQLDWALSQINLDHNLTASVVYDLPFGGGKKLGSDWNAPLDAILGNWQVTVIEAIHSGFPVPLIDSTNNSGVFFENGGNDNNFNRPNQIPGCDPYAANRAQSQFLNPACFAAPPIGELGNAARVPVSGPDFVNTDFSAIKTFALPWESARLDFRAEFFNLFNHPQFGMPINDVSTPGFGSLNSTVNNPRLVQFGLKLTF